MYQPENLKYNISEARIYFCFQGTPELPMAQEGFEGFNQADKIIRFPDKPGIEDIPEGTIATLFRENLKIAIKKRELPTNLDIDSALISLTSIVYGVPMMMAAYTDLERLPDEYDRQLNILWAGLRKILTGK